MGKVLSSVETFIKSGELYPDNFPLIRLQKWLKVYKVVIEKTKKVIRVYLIKFILHEINKKKLLDHQ